MHSPSRRKGSALILAIISFIILAGIGAAFFSFALARGKITSTASASDKVLHVAEGALDDVINKMSAYATVGSIPTGADWAFLDPSLAYTNPDSATRSTWPTIHRLTGTANGTSYTVLIYPAYDVTKKTTQKYRLVSSAVRGKEARGIESYVDPVPVGNAFDYGLFGDVFLDSGGGIFADSYKSSSGSYDSQVIDHVHNGTTYRYARDQGNVGSNGNVEVGGNTKIFGNATPGPTGTFTNQGGGFVLGSTAKAASPVELAPQIYPQAAASAATAFPASQQFGSGNARYNEVTLPTGSYQASSISFGQSTQIRVTGKVVLYVDGEINLNAQDAFIVDGVDASVTIYQRSGDMTINGQALVNGAVQKASSFQVYSSTTGNIRINGTSAVYGAVYAPGADYLNNGGAPVYGAIVAQTINILGDAAFHYDEDLDLSPNPVINYKIKSWKEFVP